MFLHMKSSSMDHSSSLAASTSLCCFWPKHLASSCADLLPLLSAALHEWPSSLQLGAPEEGDAAHEVWGASSQQRKVQLLLLQADQVHPPAPTLAEQQRTAELSQQLHAARSEARTSSLALRDAQQDWAGIVRGLTQDLQVISHALLPLHCRLSEGGWGPAGQQSARTSDSCTTSCLADVVDQVASNLYITCSLRGPACNALHCTAPSEGPASESVSDKCCSMQGPAGAGMPASHIWRPDARPPNGCAVHTLC